MNGLGTGLTTSMPRKRSLRGVYTKAYATDWVKEGGGHLIKGGGGGECLLGSLQFI